MSDMRSPTFATTMNGFTSSGIVVPPQSYLAAGEIHIWLAWLDSAESSIDNFQKILSGDEVHRAQRFHFDKDRIRFIVGRGFLRTLLSGYLNCQPIEIKFRYGSYGKPALVAELSRDHLTFNMSHSGDLSLVAIARETELGIDVEQIRNEIDFDRIAEHFFSEREIESLCSLPQHQKSIGFFNCWTRKEAYLKALGGGLSIPLNLFDVSLVPGEPAQILKCRGSLPGPRDWTLQTLVPARDYVAAVAAHRTPLEVKFWRWPESRNVLAR